MEDAQATGTETDLARLWGSGAPITPHSSTVTNERGLGAGRKEVDPALGRGTTQVLLTGRPSSSVVRMQGFDLQVIR